MTIWRTVDRRKYEYFEPDIGPDVLPGFEDLVAIWNSKKNGRVVPSWSDFDFYDFNGWHGWISVYDITYDPFDYVFRLSGEAVDKTYGRTMTGLSIADLEQSSLEPPEVAEFYEMTCREMKVVRITGPLFYRGRDFIHATYVEFPLSDDGLRATHSFDALILHKQEEAAG